MASPSTSLGGGTVITSLESVGSIAAALDRAIRSLAYWRRV